MIFEEKTIILKDGRTAILKSPCVEDAEKLLNYIKKSCSETDFLARYPEEWTTTIGQEEAWVNRLRSAPDTLGITCYVDGEDAGNCEISFRGDMKVSHRATIHESIASCNHCQCYSQRLLEPRYRLCNVRGACIGGTEPRNRDYGAGVHRGQ